MWSPGNLLSLPSFPRPPSAAFPSCQKTALTRNSTYHAKCHSPTTSVPDLVTSSFADGRLSVGLSFIFCLSFFGGCAGGFMFMRLLLTLVADDTLLPWPGLGQHLRWLQGNWRPCEVFQLPKSSHECVYSTQHPDLQDLSLVYFLETLYLWCSCEQYHLISVFISMLALCPVARLDSRSELQWAVCRLSWIFCTCSHFSTINYNFISLFPLVIFQLSNLNGYIGVYSMIVSTTLNVWYCWYRKTFN